MFSHFCQYEFDDLHLIFYQNIGGEKFKPIASIEIVGKIAASSQTGII